jgi:hypothetical protein
MRFYILFERALNGDFDFNENFCKKMKKVVDKSEKL